MRRWSIRAIAMLLALASAAPSHAARIGPQARLSPVGLRTHSRYVDWNPAEGATVDRTPPPLTWPWHPGALPVNPPPRWTFRLTVARDPGLADRVLQEQTDFNTYAMLPLLEPGVSYFWRVEWIDEQGDVAHTSKIRCFTVASDARRYDLSVLRDLPPLGHPRWCCRPQDVAALRAARHDDTLFGRAARTIRDSARKIADWGQLTPPPGWSFCPQIRELGAAHLLWGDTDHRFANLGVKGLVQACRDKVKLPETMPGGDYLGVVHTGMLFAAYDWLYDAMSEEERQLCAEELAARAHSMSSKARIVLEQAACYRDASHPMEWLTFGTMGAWILYEERPELRADLMVGINYYLSQPGPYSQGMGWTEGRGYGRSHVIYLAQKVLAPLQVGLGIPMAEYGRWGRIARFFAELTPVGEDREPYGDGGGYWRGGWGFPVILVPALTGDAETYHRLRLKGEKRHFHYLGSGVNYPPEAPMLAYYFPPLPETDLHKRTRILAPDAGFVIEHTNSRDATRSIGFSFKCSPMGWTNHCLPDQGSFCLYAWGQMLATNTGAYGAPGRYADPQDLNFNKHTISKNSLLINELGQVRCRVQNALEGRLLAYHADDEMVYCCGSFGNCYPPEANVQSVYRHFLFLRDRYFVVFDDVRLTHPGTVQWLYHLPTDCVVDRLQGGTLDYRSADVAVAFRMADEGIASTMSRRAVGADGADYSDKQKAPATHLRFQRRAPALRQQFLTVIVPYREDKPIIEVVDQRHVRVTCEGRTDLIGFGPDAGDTVDYEAIQADDESNAM